MNTHHLKKVLCTLILLGSSQVFAACDVTLSSGASISNAVAAAPGGATICLNAGSYPSFNSSISKSSTTTVTAASGLDRSQVTISSVNVGSSQNLAFVGMTIGGASVSVPGGTAALHIQFRNNAFTGPLDIYTPQNVNQDTLIDGNTFINVKSGVTEGRVGVRGYDNTTANGVVISNNVISGSGPSDGVQVVGNAYGTVIGPGNEFKNIKQSGCGTVHCDPIQFYGARSTRITGNYFHNNSTGLMLGVMDNITIDNNVFMTDGEYADQIVIFACGDKKNVIKHNTLANGSNIHFISDGCGSNVYETVYDNIITGTVHADSGLSMGTAKVGYNLTANSLAGTNNIPGKPTYTGGTSPTTWGGYQLTATSAGIKAASNGTDIGANSFGTILAAPSNLKVN
jgi:parallel beta-helix repeat protein